MSRLFLSIAAGALALSWAIPVPAQAQSTSEAQRAEAIVYQIRPGDTLSSLSTAFVAGQRTAREVARLNRIRHADLIYAHAPLRIPRHALRTVGTPARVETFSGQVVVSGLGGPRPLRAGDELGEGVTITTGRNAFVTLRLADQSTFALPSQSTVRIARLRRIVLTGAVEREFQLQNGRAKAQVTPMPNTDSTFRVNTPVSHAAVRGTVFRAAYDDVTGIALTEVEEGEVGVKAIAVPESEHLVAPRHGTVIRPASGVEVKALLGAPTLLEPGRPQTGENLEFALAPLPGASRYRIEIARDAGLLDPIAEDLADRPAFTLESQPTGTYFVRVAGVDADGLEGASRTYAFERRRNSLIGSLLRGGKGGRQQYQFKWNAVADGDPIFRFQLRRSGDAAPLVDEIGLKQNSVTIARLPAGSYSWRVGSTIQGGGQGYGKPIESWMSEQTFEVAKGR